MNEWCTIGKSSLCEPDDGEFSDLCPRPQWALPRMCLVLSASSHPHCYSLCLGPHDIMPSLFCSPILFAGFNPFISKLSSISPPDTVLRSTSDSFMPPFKSVADSQGLSPFVRHSRPFTLDLDPAIPCHASSIHSCSNHVLCLLCTCLDSPSLLQGPLGF